MTDEHDIDETLPEVVKNFLRKGAKLEDIRLHADGRWTHEGLDFENQRVIDLFSRSIGRTPGGTWVLEIPPYTYPIHVDDAPYFIERIDFAASPPMLHLSDGTAEPLDAATMTYAEGGRLYCSVKGATYRARFKRPAYYTVAEHIEATEAGFAITINGQQHNIQDT